MRIIAGDWKGAKLFMAQNNRTRPTTDFLKEVMFSVLYDVEGLQVLDLYAGSGQLALEALSRGAAHATLVDADEKATVAMWRNVDKLQCREQASVHRKKASSFLAACEQQYDLILLDPPYERKQVNKTLAQIMEHGRLAPGGRIVVEHSPREPLEPGWHITYQKQYGESMLSIVTLEEA